MTKFFLVGLSTIQYLTGVTTDQAAIEVCRHRNIYDGKGRFNLVRSFENEGGTLFELYNDNGLWDVTTLEHMLQEVEIEVQQGEDPKLRQLYEAATEHINQLEAKLDEAAKEMRNAMQAFESVDLDYSSWDEESIG